MRFIDVLEAFLIVVTIGLAISERLLPGKPFEGEITLLMIVITAGFAYLRRSPWGPKEEMTGIHLTYDRNRSPAISVERFVLRTGWFWKWNYRGKMTDHFYTLDGDSISSVECRARVLRLGLGGWLIEIKEPNSVAGFNKKIYLPLAYGDFKYGKIYGPPFLADGTLLNGEEYVLRNGRVENFKDLKSYLDERFEQIKLKEKESLSTLYLDSRETD